MSPFVIEDGTHFFRNHWGADGHLIRSVGKTPRKPLIHCTLTGPESGSSPKSRWVHYGKYPEGRAGTPAGRIDRTDSKGLHLEEIIRRTEGNVDKAAIIDTSTLAWNHTLFWNCMKPNGCGDPPRNLRQLIEDSFGSLDACKMESTTAATSRFESGWAWLVLEKNTLKIVKTSTAASPLTERIKPLYVIDVWDFVDAKAL